MIPANDLQAIALERLAHQYRESPNLRAIVELLIGQVVDLRDAILSLEPLRVIDTAFGDGLDGLGQILGQPRELAGVVALDFFALHDGTGGPAAEGFGDLADASAGQRFRHINESPVANTLLGDEEYRSMQHAKVIRNRTSATPEDIIASIQAVLGDSTPVQLSFGVSAVTATVQRVLSSEELSILNATAGIRGQIPVIPRPVGIDLTVAGL